MPQPLSTILKKRYEGIISKHPENAALQPELASLVAQAIAIWSLVDCAIGNILVEILGAKAGPAVAMYDAVSNAAAQIAAVKAAAKISLGENDERYKIFMALMSIYSAEAKQRHKFAHWVWGYTELARDHLILIRPTSLIHSRTALSQLLNKEIEDVKESPFAVSEIDEWYAYSKKELEQIVERFTDVRTLFFQFEWLLGARSETTKLLAYNSLSTHNRVQTELSRLFPPPKSDPLEPEYNI